MAGASPLGNRPQQEVANSPDADAAWLAAQAKDSIVGTTANASYEDLSKNPPSGGASHQDYDSYKHTGRE
jgi:hypothetical protein